MTTTHKCPACGKQLSHTFDDYDNLIVWCASGFSCPSIKSNAGITGLDGETFGQLARKLISQLEAQPDWEDQ